ncbi:MAG TPA: hypothetical protein VK886_10460 [Vicinamibacterales bacterium]|nr:hypothetical protein [Vicinamibacterales bacterium]
MGDSGEGLIDAEARIQEKIDERTAEREQQKKLMPFDPERLQAAESLRLARVQLEQQIAAATHPVRKQQLELALQEITRQLADLTGETA